ncbi:hypothetical protein [Cryobacterium sp. Sr8]|uniref:hypothetical protein n=1 Tax=Cryobacterium sp. Sr8 TaxID=1259203 RepID=UPI00141B1975|nr:hypothetical protein [Cryobacterium sp. Sr8]
MLAAIAVALASVAVSRGRLPRWFVIAAASAAALALLGVLLSAAPAAQLWGRWPRYEGLVTLPVYFGALWAGARLLGPGVPAARVRTLLRAAATAAIALGAVSVLEALGARPFATDLARPVRSPATPPTRASWAPCSWPCWPCACCAPGRGPPARAWPTCPCRSGSG